MGKNIKIDLDKVEQYAQACDNQADIARALGVSERTIRNRLNDDADFAEAYKRGKAKSAVFVGGKLMELIKKGNVAATIFYLKARCGWSEKTDLNVSGSLGTQITFIDNLEPDERTNN